MARSEAPASAKAAGNSYPLRLPPPRQSSTLLGVGGRSFRLVPVLKSQQEMWLWGLCETASARFCKLLWARSLRPQERQRPQPRRWRGTARSGSVRDGLRRGVRARSAIRGPRDRLELRQTEPVPAVVPRIRRAVQSEPALRAPTTWTTRSASESVASAAGSSRSARPATVATPTAPRRAGRLAAAGPCGQPETGISAVPRGDSITVTGSAPIAFGDA